MHRMRYWGEGLAQNSHALARMYHLPFSQHVSVFTSLEAFLYPPFSPSTFLYGVIFLTTFFSHRLNHPQRSRPCLIYLYLLVFQHHTWHTVDVMCGQQWACASLPGVPFPVAFLDIVLFFWSLLFCCFNFPLLTFPSANLLSLLSIISPSQFLLACSSSKIDFFFLISFPWVIHLF